MQPLEDLIKTKEFWMVRLQLDLFNAVEAFRERKGWTRSQLADHLGVTKSYVSQVLNGDFDRRLSSLVTLALAVGVVPNTTFQDAGEFEEEYMSGRDAATRRGNRHASPPLMWVETNIQQDSAASKSDVATRAAANRSQAKYLGAA